MSGAVAGIVGVVVVGRAMPFLGWFALVDVLVFGASMRIETANAAWHVRMADAGRGSAQRLQYDLIIGFKCLVWLTLVGNLVWYFTSDRKLGMVMSPTQEEFVRIVGDYRNRFEVPHSNGDALFKERDETLCRLEQARKPMAWAGVFRVGRRGLKVEVERQVFLMVSIPKSQSTTKPDLGSYKDGDEVIVTGWLNDGRKACVSELSLTNAGALVDPDFDFTLVEIRKM